MCNANDSSMNGTCNMYSIRLNRNELNRKKYRDKFFLFFLNNKTIKNRISTSLMLQIKFKFVYHIRLYIYC